MSIYLQGCCTGGPVPSSYYLSNIPELEEDTADKKVLVLQARSEENLIVHVTHTGSILW